MGTRGLVGFKHNGKLRGWYNHYDSYYDGLGLDVINKYFKLSQKQLKDFFINRIEFVKQGKGGGDPIYENHRTIWEIDWNKDNIKLEDGTDFITDGLFCEFAYVFNLDDGTLEIYRGFFKFPQFDGQDGYESDNEKYYAHMIFKIKRGFHSKSEIKKVFDKYIEWCNSECDSDKDSTKNPYPEREWIKGNWCENCFLWLDEGKGIKKNNKLFCSQNCLSSFIANKI